MFQLNKIIFTFLVLLLISCKSLKIDNNSKLNKYSSPKEVLAIHNLKNLKYLTLQSKIRANYDDGKKSVSPLLTLRMEKDKKIWISAKFLGFTVAKIFITPTRFSFYEKLNRRYYDGDLKLLANYLGQEINFEQIQNLFLGQNIIDLTSKEVKQQFIDGQIKLYDVNKGNNYMIEVLFNILNSKVSNYKIEKGNKSLIVKYATYQQINNQELPMLMLINTNIKNVKRSVEMNFKSVAIDEELSFPYTIPQGYTKFKFRS